MVNILLSVLLLLSSPLGQYQLTAPNPADECVLKGMVVSAASGEPLRKAVVSLCQVGVPNVYGCTGAVTDATGQFELKTRYLGRYVLSATCTGYVGLQYGQRKPGGVGEILNVSRGGTLSDLTIRLIPAGVIYGHVYEEGGGPVANVAVSELHMDYTHGRRELRAGAVAITNDQGEYRLWDLNPGTHFILAEYNLQRLRNVRVDVGYLPTFYPNSLDAAHASPIVLQGGDQYAGADVDLQPARTVRVRGRIYGDNPNVSVFLLLRDFTAFGDLVPPVYAQVQDNEFQLDNVTPGAYYLYAFGQDRNRPVATRQQVEVIDTDLDHVNLMPGGSSTLAGTVRVEGSTTPHARPPIQISLEPRVSHRILGPAPSTWSNPDGHFQLTHIFPGDYDLQVEVGSGQYLKSAVMVGSFDVLARGGISTEFLYSGRPLDILIGRNAATVEGVVLQDQHPYSGATVVLVPDLAGAMCRYQLAATDRAGHFVMDSVAPGSYKAFAWESVEHAAYTSPEFLQPFQLRGQSVRVSEGSQVSVNLDLIPDTEVR